MVLSLEDFKTRIGQQIHELFHRPDRPDVEFPMDEERQYIQLGDAFVQ